MTESISSIALWSQAINLVMALVAFLLAYGALIGIDKSNGSDFKAQLAKIGEGNMAVAVYEGLKFFTVGYVVATLIK